MTHKRADRPPRPDMPVLALIMSLVVLDCDGTHSLRPATENDTRPVRIVVEPGQITIHVRDSIDFRAYGMTASGDTASVEVAWSASSGSIKAQGKGKAVGRYQGDKPGEHKVIATDTTGLADTAVVTVSDTAVAWVDLAPATGRILVGETLQLVATPRDSGGNPLLNRAVTWATSDSGIARVRADGLVSGQAPGSVTITASVEGQSGTAAVTVDSMAVRIAFSRSNEGFHNPERGFMRSAWVWLDQGNLNGIKREHPDDSMVWIYFRMDSYRDRALDQGALSAIDNALNQVRDLGLKAAITFVYNIPGVDWKNDRDYWGEVAMDAPLEQVLAHIAQIKPFVVKHTDVIAAWKGGFVGWSGEWHSSYHDLTAPENRQAILDAVLDALPSERMFQLRYPRHKEFHYGGPLTQANAFSGTDASRVGHYNDCFLRDETDGGTYRSETSNYCSDKSGSEVQCWKNFIAQEGRFTPVGGETCRVNPPRTECAVALQELEMLHWSFINNRWRQEVLDSWVAGGCMETIRRRLGYRIVLKDALVPQSVLAGDTLRIEVTLTNEGYAAMYNPRPVYLVLQNGNARYTHQLDTVDPRRWEPGGEYRITATMPLPSTMESGAYKLGLWLPDRAASLQNRPQYAVRLANIDVWEAATGQNILTANLHVK